MNGCRLNIVSKQTNNWDDYSGGGRVHRYCFIGQPPASFWFIFVLYDKHLTAYIPLRNINLTA